VSVLARSNPELGPARVAALGSLPVALRAALAQVGAALATLAVAYIATIVAHPIPAAALLAVHGILATLIAWRIGLPWWWLPIQLLFAPAIVAALFLSIAPEWFLGAFGVLTLVYWSTYRTRVPLYLSGQPVWRALEALLPAHAGAKVMDLGSGLGGPLSYLAHGRADAVFGGIEAAPLPFALSWLRALGRDNLNFHFGSFWQRKLDDCDLVFAYLSPAAMPRLWDKVRKEMRPGSVFVSVEFEVPGVPPHEIISTGGSARERLYLWRF
jgi:hypothetical protein